MDENYMALKDIFNSISDLRIFKSNVSFGNLSHRCLNIMLIGVECLTLKNAKWPTRPSTLAPDAIYDTDVLN